MGSPRSLAEQNQQEADLRAIAEAAGCKVLWTRRVDEMGVERVSLELDAPDNDAAIVLLNGLALHDSMDPDVIDIALRLRAMNPAQAGKPIQQFINALVDFTREPDERFAHTLFTIEARSGDCDDHARATCALALAAGLHARVVGVKNNSGEYTHVCSQVFDPLLKTATSDGWTWIETTIHSGRERGDGAPANYGEEPKSAAMRLGLMGRHDVTQ